MAKKKSKVATRSAGVTRKRKRRTDEELIRDLQEKIRLVKERQEARQVQRAPHLRASVSALRSIDKALDKAAEANDTYLRHVLGDARKPLAQYLEQQGIRVPKGNLPRGRRPKPEKVESEV